MSDLKCKCEAGERTNAAGQSRALLSRLQNPVVLRFIGLLPAMPYTGRVSGLQYRAGGRFRKLCVDERDVPGFLGYRHAGAPLFVETKTAEREVPPPADDLTPPDPAQVLADLRAIEGIGEKTAGALIDTGYTAQMLASLDVGAAAEVAAKAEISEGVARRAIEGAQAWAAGA